MQTCSQGQLTQNLQILQSIGSLVLVAITAIYAVSTSKIVKETKRGAEAALRSAQSSEKSTLASLRTTQIAEAALKITFKGRFTRFPNGDINFDMTPTSANVWVHEVTMDPIIVTFNANGRVSKVSREGEVQLDLYQESLGPLPAFVHCDEPRAFKWSNPTWSGEPTQLLAFVEVSYSLHKDSEVRKRILAQETCPDLQERVTSFMEA